MANLKDTVINDTGYIKLPSGTILQRPSSPVAGMLRFNTDINSNEYYNGTVWVNTRSPYGNVIDSLKLYADFGNGYSYPGESQYVPATTVYNLSGSSNGTLFNSPICNYNGYMTFDGINDYAIFSDSNNAFTWKPPSSSLTYGNTSITIEMWVRLTSNSYGFMVSKPWNGSGQYNYMIKRDYVYTTHIGTGQSTYSPFDPIPFNIWTHFVVIANPSRFIVYTNGIIQAAPHSHNITNYVISADYGYGITLMTLYPYGSTPEPFGAGHAQSGDVSLFRFYSRELTQSEIVQNYNEFRDRHRV